MNPDRYPSVIAALSQLVKHAYNEGFMEGMKENTHRHGGKSWNLNPSCKQKLIVIMSEFKTIE